MKLLGDRRTNIGGLSEEELLIVDVVCAAADLLVGDVKNPFMLEELLTLINTIDSCRLLANGMGNTKDSVWFSMSIRKLGEKFAKVPRSVLHAALLFTTRQHTEHIRKLMFEGIDIREEFVKSCESDDEEIAALKHKGNEFFKVQNYESAIASYQQAINKNPFNHILYSNRAFSYLKTGRLQLALADAKRCVVLRVGWEKGQYRYAQALFELGQHEKAIEANLNGQRCCISHSDLDRQYQVFMEKMGKTGARSEKTNQTNTQSTQQNRTATGR